MLLVGWVLRLWLVVAVLYHVRRGFCCNHCLSRGPNTSTRREEPRNTERQLRFWPSDFQTEGPIALKYGLSFRTHAPTRAPTAQCVYTLILEHSAARMNRKPRGKSAACWDYAIAPGGPISDQNHGIKVVRQAGKKWLSPPHRHSSVTLSCKEIPTASA